MATTDQVVQYYQGLLILQYQGKPKALATIAALVSMVIADQVYRAVQDAFSLDTAEGVQLDAIGNIVGASRYGHDFSGPVTLDDDDFRQFLRIAIIQNTAQSSLGAVQALLTTYFNTIILVFDHLGMRINYYFNSSALSPQLAEFFVMSGRLPKPIGVQLGAIVYTASPAGYFGYARNNKPAFQATGFSRNTGFVGKQLRNGDFL